MLLDIIRDSLLLLDAVTALPDAATASTSALDDDVTELPSMSAVGVHSPVDLTPMSAALVPGAHSPVDMTPMSAALVPGAHSPVDLTPLLPHAPTTLQDLLANILHQMTTPTTAGEHDGAVRGGITQFFVLRATLDPKVKVKIREGAYVDLGSLCAPSDASVSVAMGSDGNRASL